MPEYYDNLLRADRLEKMADGLMSVIEWGKTTQGFDYWNNVHTNLLSLAEELRGEN